MLRKYYEAIAGRLSWKLTFAWAIATACGLLVTAYLSPAIGVFSSLASLAVLLLVASGADRRDGLRTAGHGVSFARYGRICQPRLAGRSVVGHQRNRPQR